MKIRLVRPQFCARIGLQKLKSRPKNAFAAIRICSLALLTAEGACFVSFARASIVCFIEALSRSRAARCGISNAKSRL